MELRDLKKQYQMLKMPIDTAISEVLEHGNFIRGRQVTELEQSLAEYVGVRHCITCANGTDAISLVLMAWKIGVGDAVFVPDFTFFSTAEAVALAGATPIFVDVNENTFNIDPVRLQKAIEQVKKQGKMRLKAIIAVDLFGLPANYTELELLASKYGLLLLEDAAQGFGGTLHGRRAGSFGNAATTSFFPAKPLGCYGDGGAVFTNDSELWQQISSLAMHGVGSFKYEHLRVGINSRLDTLQAAVLAVKLKAFSHHELTDVKRIADYYTKKLDGVVKTPMLLKGYTSGWAQYTIVLKDVTQRDLLQNSLKKEKIPTTVYYPKPLHAQPAFVNFPYVSECPVSQQLCKTVLSLPMHPYLTKQETEQVVVAVTLALT